MGALPVVLLLCGFHVFTAGAQTGNTAPPSRSLFPPSTEAPGGTLSSDCREEMYPCTRMYSVHGPTRKCIGGFCLYSLQRMYVINKEICTRTVCSQDEYMKAELCRERSGWPRRIERSSNQRRRCRSRRGNPDTWANKV